MPVASTSPRTNGRIDAVRRAIGLMRDSLCEPLSLTDLAGMALFSPFHFHRLFRETTGMTPARFLAALRMAEARRLLLHTDLTVAAVGTQVGYASAGTFTTQFTRLVGEPPARFRQLARQLSGRRWARSGGTATAPLVPGSAESVVVRIGGEVPAGCLLAGLEPVSDDGPGDWTVWSAGDTPVLPAEPGRYLLRVVVIQPGVALTDALIDEAPGSRMAGETTVWLRPNRRSAVEVTVRSPSDIDPPVLAAAPLHCLASSLQAGCSRVLRVS